MRLRVSVLVPSHLVTTAHISVKLSLRNGLKKRSKKFVELIRNRDCGPSHAGFRAV